jgi:hypothetical protein
MELNKKHKDSQKRQNTVLSSLKREARRNICNLMLTIDGIDKTTTKVTACFKQFIVKNFFQLNKNISKDWFATID